jgi:6-phosphogluconolactonase (cycloisomerase 2 family)
MQNRVLSFSDYTKESTYKVGPNGTELQEWSYYKDHYPEKYSMSKEDQFVWVIKHKDDKIMIIHSSISEDKIKSILNEMKKTTVL